VNWHIMLHKDGVLVPKHGGVKLQHSHTHTHTHTYLFIYLFNSVHLIGAIP
jgi:hypothetical protein